MNVTAGSFEARMVAIEQEQSVLGALLRRNDAADLIGDLKEEHFFDQTHRAVFRATMKLIGENKPADIMTVHNALIVAGGFEIDLSYLNNLLQTMPSAANAGRYAQVVIDRAIKRALVEVAHEAIEIAHKSPADAVELVDAVSTKLELLGRATVQNEPELAADGLDAHLTAIDQRASGEMDLAISTGMEDLDRQLNGGFRRGNLIVLAARPKMGKAQPLNSKVLMADGAWKMMGDITIGDKVTSVDGAESIVTGIFPQGKKQTYRITFSDGRSTRCCAEHLWQVRSRHWAEDRVISLEEIIKLLKTQRHSRRLSIPLISGDFGRDINLHMDPYTLGAMLGDGNMTNSTMKFSTAETETLDHILFAYPKVTANFDSGVDYRLVTPRGHANPITDGIVALGLRGLRSHEKFIPLQYLSASRISRLALLQGLMDTDGWVEKSGTCMFSSSSKALADNVCDLARSLGYIVRRATKETSFSYLGEIKKGMTAHVLRIAGIDRTEMFRMDRKKALCGYRTPRLVIETIEMVEEEECQCIQVSHPSHLYVTDDYIATHNTALAANIANYVAKDGIAALFSMEMSKSNLHDRNLASLGGIHLDHLLDPRKLTEDDWNSMTRAVLRLKSMKLYLDDQAALTLFQVAAKAKQIKRKAGGLDLLVIDYLQLMSATGGNRNAEIESITRGLKGLAKDLDIAILLLSQLNRKLEDRPNKRPQPADLRDSGSIEQDCDIAMFVYRDEVYNQDSPDKGTAEVNVALNRQGASGTVRLQYTGEHTKFHDLSHNWRPEIVEPVSPPRKKGF